MASQLDKLKDTILSTINGGNPAALLIQQLKSSASKAIAEAKYIADTLKTTLPQKTKLLVDKAKLEAQKAEDEAKLILAKDKAVLLNTQIFLQEQQLKLEQQREAQRKKKQDKDAARAKAHGESVPEEPEQNEVRIKKAELDANKKELQQINQEITDTENSIDTTNNEINEIDKTTTLLDAQVNPEDALKEAQRNVQVSQQNLDNADTQQAKQAATEQLEIAQQQEEAIQDMMDVKQATIQNEQQINSVKFIQLQAEYQIMDSGISTLNYLITNIPLLLGPSGMTAVPMTIVAGSAVGTANPTYVNLFGNVLYGYAFQILANVKAASLRFLALAQDMNYTPTSEMAIINSIAPTEATLKSTLAAFAPAGSALVC